MAGSQAGRMSGGWLTLTSLSLLLGATGCLAQGLTWVQLHKSSHSKDNISNAPRYPPGRSDAVMGYDVTRNRLILFGGRPGPLGDTWIYNVSNNEWQELNFTGLPSPPARYAAVGGVSGDYFYVATGKGGGNVFYNDVWRMNLTTNQWEEMPPAPRSSDPNENNSSQPYTPSARSFASGGIYQSGTRLYVSLGTNDDMLTKYTFAYDVASHTWFKEHGGCSLYDPRCPHPRYLQGGVMTGREQFVIFSGCLSGKGSAGPCPSHDTWRYDGQTGQWEQLDTCPAPRLYSTMAMLPHDGLKRYAVLYGGQSDTSTVIEAADVEVDEVAVLDVQSGSWTTRQVRPENNVSSVPGLRLSAAMATGSDGIFLFGGASLHEAHANDLWLLRGNADDADQSPSSSCARTTITLVTVHGILMSLGFGLLLPVGALLMRHFKCLYTHVTFQILGLCCAIAGLVLGVISVSSSHFSFAHAIAGIVALGLAVLQPINALFRPKQPRPEERKGAARTVWQFVHRFGGRGSVLLGLANGSLGIFLAVAELPIIIAYHAWAGFLVLLCLLGECVRCMRLARQKARTSRPIMSTLQTAHGNNQSDGIINGWEKGDSAYVNSVTESVRL